MISAPDMLECAKSVHNLLIQVEPLIGMVQILTANHTYYNYVFVTCTLLECFDHHSASNHKIIYCTLGQALTEYKNSSQFKLSLLVSK